MLLDGVHIPLTTPFYPDGRVYLRKLEHNVRRYSLTPVHGLIALGGTSESALLTDDERVEVLRVVGAEAAREKVLLAEVGVGSVFASLRLAEKAAEFGFDAILLRAPEWLWDSDSSGAGLNAYFEAIADRSPLPVVIVSAAGKTSLPIETIGRLSGHPNVMGLEERSRHLGRVVQIHEATSDHKRSITVTPTFNAATVRMLRPAEGAAVVGASFVSAESLGGGSAIATAPPVPAIKTRTKDVGFQILWSGVADATEALRAGACGFAFAMAAAVPQASFEVWAAWKDGDTSLMGAKQERLRRAEEVMVTGDDGISAVVPAIKAGSELSGYFGGRPRLPLLGVTAERQAEIAQVLDGMRS